MTNALGSLTGSMMHHVRQIVRVPEPIGQDARRADRQIAFNRTLFGIAFSLYSAYLEDTGKIDGPGTMAVSVGYLTVALGILIALSRSKLSVLMRHGTLLFDISCLTGTFLTAGEYAVPGFTCYVWLQLGYGFRHGIYYGRLAAALNVIGVSIVVSRVPSLGDQTGIVVLLYGIILVVPLYFELLLRQKLTILEHQRESNRAKAVMLAEFCHELRTPLIAILDATQQMEKTRPTINQIELIGSVRTTALALTTELDDFLDASRIDAGRVDRAAGLMSVRTLVGQALGFTLPSAQAKGLRLTWHISTQVPEQFEFDGKTLLKIVVNLLNNAVRFTAAGSILLNVDVSSGWPYMLRVEITDTGIGVAHGARERIFESFMQENPAILASHGGAGLGLWVARQLTSLLGGQIGIRSRVKRGSTFWLELPLPWETIRKPAETLSQRIGLLLLSAQSVDRDALANRLHRLGIEVLTTDRTDGVGAALLGASDEMTHFVAVVDGREGDPVEIADILRDDPAVAAIPRILLMPAGKPLTVQERRRYVTAFAAESTDDVIRTAIRLATNETDAASETPEISAPADPRAKLRIIVAAESDSVRMIVRDQLETAGHSIVAVSTGDEVLEQFASETFDAAILDVQDPEQDGFDTAKLIRYISSENYDLPIIGITDSLTPALLDEARAVGMTDLLSYPITLERLKAALENVSAGILPPTEPEAEMTGVEAIESHPKFRVGRVAPLLNSDLRSQVLIVFEANASAALAVAEAAIGSQDAEIFRSQMCILRKISATLGTPRFMRLCREGEALAGYGGARRMPTLLDELKQEVRRVVSILKSETA